MPKLPYAADALAPVMSKETIDYHYGKHLQTYIDNLNRLIADTPYAEEHMPRAVLAYRHGFQPHRNSGKDILLGSSLAVAV